MTHDPRRSLLRALLLSATMLAGGTLAGAASAQTLLPSGQSITPTATPGSNFQDLNPGLSDHPKYRAGEAVKTVLSPDGGTLLVLTSGYNNLSYSSGSNLGNFEPSASNEYVFVYDTHGANRTAPLLKQVIQIPDAFEGLAFAPNGQTFYASGGVDDTIYVYSNPGLTGSWTRSAAIPLGHATGIGASQQPSAGGLALSLSGNILVVANTYNDSISVINTQTNTVSYEYDLRPYNTTPATGDGVAGGETPFTVAVKGEGTVYVSSVRDREVVVVDISTGTPKLITRIPMSGSPNSMVFSNLSTQDKLYVAQDNSDRVAVIDTTANSVIEDIDAIAPDGVVPGTERYTGAGPNGIAISGTGNRLYVTNGGANDVAVISLAGPAPHKVVGLIPTGWFPESVTTGQLGNVIYVSNGKSVPGANINNLTGSTYALTSVHYPGGNQNATNESYAANQYVFQLEQAGLLTLSVPDDAGLVPLTRQVATNNGYSTPESTQAQHVMAALHQNIKHVIYIVKENRTFDQVLGDINNGSNADPLLAVFGQRVTPNLHRLAGNFVTLDNFYDTGEVSGDGWEWVVAARETDFNTKALPMDYATSPLIGGNRAAPYEGEGQNRDIDVGIATLADRETAEPEYPLIAAPLAGGVNNLLPGTNNDGAPDGPDGATQTGYLWDSALRAGLTIRNYGFYLDLGRYFGALPAIPLDPTPYADNSLQAISTNPSLAPYTDIYFRGFDNNYPDIYRFNEWQREFNNYVAGNSLPALSFVRLMHDHMGSFTTAIGGINTPETQQADNDYAVGKLIDAVAHSPYKENTLIFIEEDDAQDGPDHVDAHRSEAYVVGPYVKQHAIIHTRYSSVSMVRTIEDVLGIDHLNLNDAYQEPMWQVFDLNQKAWSYHAVASPFLNNTVGALETGTEFADNMPAVLAHPATWWADQTKGFDWSKEDRIPADLFNRVIWKGMKGDVDYPAVHGATTDQD